MSVQGTDIAQVDIADVIKIIEQLSDRALLRIKGYAECIREEEVERKAEEEERRDQRMTLDEVKAEIAALKARYGTTPNAETIAAMKEVAAGIGEPTTLEKIKAECNALRY
jgi:hypothetical protein